MKSSRLPPRFSVEEPGYEARVYPLYGVWLSVVYKQRETVTSDVIKDDKEG